MGSLTDEAIRAAWADVYGAWAWATDLRQSERVVDLLRRPVPSDTSGWFAMLTHVPAPRRADDIWQEFGFDPKSSTDFKARLVEVEKLRERKI